MRAIDGLTQIYGILGDPVTHSLSPAMQNQAMRQAGLNAVYLPFHVVPQDLPAAVEGLRALHVGGVNITLPHKEQILPLLDRVDEDAALIGAVNTLVRRGDELVGYNTDGLGFIRALDEDLDFIPEGKRVLLLGAGGACRAAAVSLLRAGTGSLTVVNRNLERAERLVRQLVPVFPNQHIIARGVGDCAYLTDLRQADLVVNTTSLGLKGEPISFCPLEKIKASALVYDMVYSLAETPFVRAAKTLGLSAADGMGMLAGQGEEAFSLWFGLSPEKGLMKKCLQQLCAKSNI
ncbi:shikimate dehydrogenase [Geopsychrobacter electrodiphilus]|uniref:shikimate dehydrogenase n=1 Tax=Geopsychrobacter electrodiphilus TaxID=225196 RepID=UPI00035F0969|nr:shikimate dehydrogenase [Geopsychrobacter electrodiphilus]